MELTGLGSSVCINSELIIIFYFCHISPFSEFMMKNYLRGICHSREFQLGTRGLKDPQYRPLAVGGIMGRVSIRKLGQDLQSLSVRNIPFGELMFREAVTEGPWISSVWMWRMEQLWDQSPWPFPQDEG